MKIIGNILPVDGESKKNFNLGIGLEKLDRDCFDPEKVYDKIAELGVKWVRIQSGWVKTEQSKGVYDFDWLDKIVDNIIKRGMTPWMCLCYGNELYDETADNKTGAIGRPPIFSKEAKDGWSNYVTAVTSHFKGRVPLYEIWNEPDGGWCWKHGVNGREYGRFAVDTSKAIKRGDMDAKIAGGSFCWGNMLWLAETLSEGMGDAVDFITYHSYCMDVDTNTDDTYKNIKATLKAFGSKADVIQGETGAPSQRGGKGAISAGYWSEEAQAKYILRLLVTDLANGVYFSSVFSAVDMYENLSGSDSEKTRENYGFFGVLREEFSGNIATGKYSEKPSFKALQSIASLFDGNASSTYLPVSFARNAHTNNSPKTSLEPYPVKRADFEFQNGKKLFAYWKPVSVDTMSFEGTVNVYVAGMKKPKLVDPMSGEIFELDKEIAGDPCIWNGKSLATINDEVSNKDGMWNLNLQIKDYPMFLMFEE